MRLVAVALEVWNADLTRMLSLRVSYVRADGVTLTRRVSDAGLFAERDAALIAERHLGTSLVPA